MIDEGGNVAKAKARCGDTVLARAAEEAALKSKFTRLKVSGKAVKFSGFVVYNFAND